MMGSTQTITTNGASELVVMPRTEYDRLITELEDAKDITAAKEFEAREAIGDAEFLPWEMAKRLRSCGWMNTPSNPWLAKAGTSSGWAMPTTK